MNTETVMEFTIDGKIAIIDQFIRDNITRSDIGAAINLTPTKLIDRTKNSKEVIGKYIVVGAVLTLKYQTPINEIVGLINDSTIVDYLFDKLEADGYVEDIVAKGKLIYHTYDQTCDKWKPAIVQ